ncbi:MAG: glycosyltransferase family 4 protein [Desulfovibrio sp.]|nr:glycosyltransferase family 4 protein [Desulfovibrio sp.]
MPLKVCLYISRFAPGGAERQMVNLACELADRGLQVLVLHIQKDLQDAAYLQDMEGHRVKILDARSQEYLQEGIRLSRLHTDFFKNIPAPHPLRMEMLYLAGAFSRLKPDIVHSYQDMPNCTAGCAAILADVPAHLASFHSLDPATSHYPWETQTYALYRYLLLHGHPHFEACSRASVQRYAHWLDIAPEAIAYTPNGLDPTAYLVPTPQAGKAFREAHGIGPDAPVLLTLSRFAPYKKAPESIVDICARVQAQRPDCHFLVAGSGMAEDEGMGALVKERGVGNQMHLLGLQRDVAPLFASSDIFLLPSRVEGFPISIMEAMATGLPVVASNVGGIPDLVRHGKDGFLHDPQDVEGMAHSVAALLADAGLRARLGAGARERLLKEFSLRKMGDRILQRYQEMLAGTGRARG